MGFIMVKDKRTRGWQEREGILTSDVEEALLSVTDVKHYVYCPRIIYFEKVLHAQPRLGSQQEESKEIHGELEERELRRKGVIPYVRGFEAAKKFFRVRLTSPRLRLQGTIDCIVKLGREYIPVDYKNMESNRGKPWLDHKYQLTAYALLVEEDCQTTVRQGYINYLPEKLAVKLEITPTMKTHVKRILTRIEKIVGEEKLPSTRPSPKKCTGGCGYKWICLPERK